MVDNNFFCQQLADMTGLAVDRPQVTETTALGAAILAGLTAGFGFPWSSVVIGPLLILMPPVVMLIAMRWVHPEAHPTRSDQVLWLAGVTCVAVWLGSWATSVIAPATWTVSFVDQFIFAIGIGIVEWLLLFGLQQVVDATFLAERSFLKPWHCRECGYDLRGAASPQCPECAAPIHCRRCGKSLTGARDGVCMFCGTPLAAKADELFDED